METDKDHIHILFKTKPTINMTKCINHIKGGSSRILFHEYPEIKMKYPMCSAKADYILWKGHLWSTSYCLLTTGQTTLDVLKKYVESQGEEGKEDINNTKENSCKTCEL